jgi:ribonuclease III
MGNLTVVFRTRSDIEASIVQSLLESHGIDAIRSAGPPPGVFAFTTGPFGDTRVSVRDEDAEEAAAIIASHRDEIGGGFVVPLPQQLAALEERLGYRFRDRGLLEHALTHRSKAAEDPSGGVVDNESLEFLGDAVLGFVVADLLFRGLPDSREGQKSKVKSAVVSTLSLAEAAARLGLGEHLILGRGEEKTGGRKKSALLADTYEALIAAIYLDGGLAPALAFIERELGPAIHEARAPGFIGRDYKSRLQERVQIGGGPLPSYRISAEVGPDHRKQFHVEVRIGDEVIAEGVGRTKKDAEQEAARAALAALADRRP